MMVALMEAVIWKECGEIDDFWKVEEGLPGLFNKDKGYQGWGGEMRLVAICMADPDVPHMISADDMVNSIFLATGVCISKEDFQIERMENMWEPMWKLSTHMGDLVDRLLVTGGGIMNYKEYYFTQWFDFRELRFMVNTKGVLIQVKPRELAELIEGYSGIKVSNIEFVKKKGIYQNYQLPVQEDHKFLVKCSPTPLLAGLPGIHFQVPTMAAQIQKVPGPPDQRQGAVVLATDSVLECCSGRMPTRTRPPKPQHTRQSKTPTIHTPMQPPPSTGGTSRRRSTMQRHTKKPSRGKCSGCTGTGL
jgi:hypothetical protein